MRVYRCRDRDRNRKRHTVEFCLPPGRAHRPRKRSVIEGCPRHGTGRPCGAGREGHPGSGRHASQPGTAGSVAVVHVFALRLTAPLVRVCSSDGAQPRPPSTLPACAGTQGGRGRVRLRHGASQPAWRRSVQRCGFSRPRPPPVCQRLQRYLAARCPGGLPSLRAPHGLPVPWRCRCGAARLRGLCAPSAAEPMAAAATQQGRPAGRPQVIAYSVVPAPAT